MTKVKKKRLKSTRNRNLLLFIFAAVFGVLGVWLFVTSQAATTNFEAESATKSSEVTIANDTNASGGKYAQFASTVPGTTNVVQRFPGDPNPRVTGKTYWGANVFALLPDGTKTSDVYNRHEKPADTSLALHHRYFQWSNVTSNGASSIVNAAKTDHTANRLPYVTFKTNDSWAAMGNGSHDASIDALLRGLDSLGKPVWLTAWHEPENDTNGGTRTASTWKSMQTRIRQRMNALGTKNIAFMPHFMGGTTRNDNGASYDINQWWLDGIWDVVMFSNYCQRSCVDGGGNTFDTGERKSSIKFLESKGVPWGVGEWSLSERTTGELKFTKYFMSYFEQGFKGDGTKPYDAVAYSYFDADESRPDGSSPYYATLRDANLDEFHRIMRDPRVMRINDLTGTTPPPSSSNYGTLTSSITVPTTGTYKVWVRMSAPNNSANSVSLSVQNGPTIKVGDYAIPANTWTWVDYQNGNVATKNNISLSSGTKQITLTGIEPGVKVDRVIITSDNCTIPTGNGDDCASPTSPPATKTGDLNSDNKIDVLDLSILLSNWNPIGTTNSVVADINKDGKVDVLDLSVLLSNWGK